MDEIKIRSRMQTVLEMVQQGVGTIRTGRATPALVEGIVVDCYGSTQKLRVLELASITAPDSQTLLVSPWDKSIIGEIRAGIEKANIGLTPVIAGEVIRINLPPMTSEDRENYVRLLHQQLENGRIAVRQARQDAMKEIKRMFDDKNISEDEHILQEKKVQEITDEYVGKIDEMGKRKETELRTV